MTPPVPLPPPVPLTEAEQRRRRTGRLAMLALALVAAALAAQRLLAPDTTLQAGPVVGPLNDGAPASLFHPGDSIAWSQRLCGGAGTAQLQQARLVRLSDNQVLLYREGGLATDAAGCSQAQWAMALPAAPSPGQYVLQRFVLLTPRFGPAGLHRLAPLAVQLAAARASAATGSP